MAKKNFKVGDVVYAQDWAHGVIHKIDAKRKSALVEFNDGVGGGSLWFNLKDLVLDDKPEEFSMFL